MKLRIKGNSIRLRLLRSEVDKFSADGKISEDVVVGPGTLRYSLRMSSEAESIQARFVNDEIEVLIPEAAARAWATNGDVGFEAEQAVATGETLAIVIEKDFVCVDRPDDPDRDDAYPNPNVTC
jgi:hypothetical protein